MIKIITVGKIKEEYLGEAIKEYEKRIRKYCKLEIIEVKDEAFDEVKTLLRERDSIMKYISDKDYIVTMEIEGTQMDSVTFANKLDNIMMNNSDITFIIGGSYGLHEDIKNMSNLKLSFSKMTFPHQLFRVILLEQIFRAFKILNNETYHK